MEETFILIGKILGYVTIATTFLTYLMKTPKKLLFVMNVGNVILVLSYLFMQMWVGAALNAICIVRNIIYGKKSEGGVWAKPYWCYIFMATTIASGILTWTGWISVLMIVALTINAYVFSLGRNQLLRGTIIFTSTLIVIYNLYYGNVGSAINETIAIVSSIIGLIIYARKRKEQNE